jgi:proline iminopeptidase
MKLKFLNLQLLFFLVTTLGNCQNIEQGNYFETIGTLKLNFTIRGKGPIVIVGHPNSGKIGYELSLAPLESHFTMVYYEPRGTGKSEAPKTIEGYSQNYLVQEIEDLRKFLNVERIWIFGHSDQSAVALEYALKHQDNISGLIITGTSFIGTQQESIERRKEFEEQRAKESEWFAQVIKNWDYMEKYKTSKDQNENDISTSPIKWWCYDEASSQKVIPIVKEISKVGRRKSIENQNYYETPRERQNYLDNQKQFSKIATKTLIINGRYDTNNNPKYAEELSHILPNSKLVLIEKAGHFPWIENSDEAFKEINIWLNKNQ